MNWNKLKNNKCPNCSGLLLGRNGSEMACPHCGFSISNEKFEKIVNDMYKKPKFISDDDRLSELNNLGREEITEGFLGDSDDESNNPANPAFGID